MKFTKKSLIIKCGQLVAKTALAVGKDSVNRSCCLCWFYQPKVPQALKRLKK